MTRGKDAPTEAEVAEFAQLRADVSKAEDEHREALVAPIDAERLARAKIAVADAQTAYLARSTVNED